MAIQNVECEQQILGAFLLSKESYWNSHGVISADDFSDPVHAEIFEVMKNRFESDDLVSPVTIKTFFEAHEGLKALGGVGYFAKLSAYSAPASQVPDYCKILKEVSARRKMSELLSKGLEEMEKGDVAPADVVGRLEASLSEMGQDKGDGMVSMLQATTKAAEDAVKAHQGEGSPGITSGLVDLDKMTGGFHAGQLILLGGRPSMGKTAVALSMVMAAAKKGVGVAVSSLEMTPESLALRSISNHAASLGVGMPYTDAMRGDMSESDARNFFESAVDVGSLPIEIMPPSMRDIGAIYAGARKASRVLSGKGTPLGLIVVDYLQLISSSGRDRFQQIAEISIALKGLSLRMGVPVLALSQLSRALESRDNKRPVLSDLRESGQLEQDADTVIFCYRNEYYLEREKPDESSADFIEWQDVFEASRNKLELIVAKQRMGAIGTVHVGFNPATNFLWDAV